MKLVNILLGLSAVCFALFACVWMAIGAWPREWVEWRAEWGDRLAVEEMFQRTMSEGNSEVFFYWNEKRGEITEREVLFLAPDSRRVMHKLLQAQGKETPLLDIVGNK